MNTTHTNKKNWRLGLATTFAVAAFTATVTNYAIWEEDVLSDYTYTNDAIAIDDQLIVGATVTSATDPRFTLSGEGDLTIYDGTPIMSFVDSTNTNDPSWSMGQVSNNGDFNISWRGDLDTTGGSAGVTQHVLSLEDNSPANAIQTFANVDVSFANGDIYWDDSRALLGVNTSTPIFTSTLDIRDSSPELSLTSSSSNSGWRFAENGGNFSIDRIGNFSDSSVSSRPDVMVFTDDARVRSIVLTGDGAGFGTSTPAASLEVERDDGTAKLLVEEQNSTPQKRRLLELSNNGAASLLFTDTSNTVQWELNPNSTGNFIINSVNLGPVGSAAEMSINRLNGLVNFRGDVNGKSFNATSSRETKEEFKPVDNTEILDKVASLEITNWKFKTDAADAPRHIGPMAEEFEEVFQLGTDGKTIGMTDVNGIALASIQALHAENSELKERLDKLEKLLATQ